MLHIDNLDVALSADAGIVKAVDGLSLSLRRGETFALVGESGCGKSMTALALMRLLPENGWVEQGHITLATEPLLDLPEARMRRVRGGRVAMIFQEPSTSLNPVMTVGEQIVESIVAHTSLRGAAARSKAVDWLRRVGIPDPDLRVDDYPFRMSGGQKQRVMIAVALAAEPDVLVADEPTTALDVTLQRQILDLLRELQAERQLGLLLITHDLAVVSGMAHRVALMYAGQIVEVADAEAFFAHPRHPYARLLLDAVPDGGRRGRPLAAIPGHVPPAGHRFQGCRFADRCDRAMPACRTQPPPFVLVDGAEVRCVLFGPGPEAAPPAGRAHAVAAVPPASVTWAEGDAHSRLNPSRLDAPAAPSLLQVDGLTVRFPVRSGVWQRTRGFFTAVDGVSLSVPAGTTLALVGGSGCGKTTLGKALAQLLGGVARVDGTATLDQHDLLRARGPVLKRARQDLQVIFQDPFASLNPRMRVADVLEEGVRSLRPEWDAAARRARVESMVERVGLRRDALERWPHEFSGGQRQRIAIARALAVQPRLIVCDEPTSALDVSVQAQILNLLRDLQQEFGLSYLFITHNIGVVEYIADHVAVMERGRIEEAGTVDAVLGAPASGSARRLLDAVPRLGKAPGMA